MYSGSELKYVFTLHSVCSFPQSCVCVFKVIDETLSPTWDEMLIFNEVVIYGVIDEIKEEPPTIVIEIFDQDRVVSTNLNLTLCLPWTFVQVAIKHISLQENLFE